MSHDQNPNAPTLRGSSAYMQMANVKRHQRSWTEPTRAFEYGLGSTGRKGQHRALQVLFRIGQSVVKWTRQCKFGQISVQIMGHVFEGL